MSANFEALSPVWKEHVVSIYEYAVKELEKIYGSVEEEYSLEIAAALRPDTSLSVTSMDTSPFMSTF
jgi:hypothetical protein